MSDASITVIYQTM